MEQVLIKKKQLPQNSLERNSQKSLSIFSELKKKDSSPTFAKKWLFLSMVNSKSGYASDLLIL